MIPFLKKNKDGKKPPKPTVPRTAQESIPFQRMFEDGTCRVRPGYYTRTIQYQDINYQLAQQEDKTAIFEEWCSFLNFFDSSIHFELSFVNTATDSADFEKSIRIPYQQDGFDDVRAEYSQMLRQQLSKGNNGLTKTKFLTYGIEGDSMAQVKPRLEHIQNDLMNNFHRLGVLAKPLDGTERLRLMHGMLNMDGANKFHFNWKDLVPSGLSVKDAIAPTALAFKNSRTFQLGGIFGAVSFLNITASDLSDQLLKDFLDMDSSQIVTMHIQSVDQNKAIKTIKRTITELDRSKIEEQKKAVRAGYDMDVLPSDLATYGRDAKALLKELQSQNERMFLVTFLVLNTGKTEQELETNVFQAVSIAQKHNCELCRLDFQQEQGLMSSLPLADCQIEIQRGLTTSSTAIFVPFTTQELFDNGKEVRYYLSVDAILTVDNGAEVKVGDVIARIPRESSKTKDITGGLPRVAELFEARRPKDQAIISDIDGMVEFGKDYKAKQRITVVPKKGEPIEYLIPKGRHLVVQDGDIVKKGDLLVEGTPAPHDILRVLGVEKLAEYLVKEVQDVYRLQGVKINDKHIEVIVSQMLRKVEVTVPGDTTFLIGEQVDRDVFEAENAKVIAENGTPAQADPILLGITKAALQTKSFISAASFQETTRVLTEAAVAGKVDKLVGLKENVIVGRLIPAGTGTVLRALKKVAAQNDKEILALKEEAAQAQLEQHANHEDAAPAAEETPAE